MNKTIFSGFLILVCCLFFEIGAVRSATDISGQCIPVSLSTGSETTADSACMAAGHGPCASVGGSYFGFATCADCENNVNGLVGAPNPITSCDTVRTNVGANKCIKVSNLVCNMKSWGALPKPGNVPGELRQSVKNTTDWLLGFVGMIAVLMIIWGGVGYLTSAGDEEKAETGKRTIKYGIMGLVIAGIAYALVSVIVVVILR